MTAMIPTLWCYDVSKKTKCPYCDTDMYAVCSCGAYTVTDKTRNLPLERQPYVGKVLD